MSSGTLQSRTSGISASRLGERGFLLAAAALLVWLLVWVRLSWPYTLDDALIHLRYADHLLHRHRISYDGVHDSFGTSSLLYVALLAALRAVWVSPLLPRVVSTIVYVVLFGSVVLVLFRGLRPNFAAGSYLPRLLGLALLAVLVEPSAARWLNDGMETGLVFLDALLAVAFLRALQQSPERPPVRVIAAGLLWGALSVWLRIELLLLAGVVTAMALLELLAVSRRFNPRPSFRSLLAALVPLLGGCVAALVVRLATGYWLPDTAAAKAFGTHAWDETLTMSAFSIVSSFSFGVGLLLLWLGSFLGLVANRRVRPADVCANALLPVVLLLSAVRGQQIQGIRYLGWTMFFPLLWNILRAAAEPVPQLRRMDRFLVAAAVLFLCALAPAAVLESPVFYRLFQGRGSALDTFRAGNLTGLRGQLGIAEDVGFVGYFTQGDICDPYGLVNGRAIAAMTYQPRFDRCMSLRPVFAFGSETFLQRVQWERSLAGWSVCGRYRFDNIRTQDVHYLVVDPAEVQAACPGSARPVEEVLPQLF